MQHEIIIPRTVPLSVPNISKLLYGAAESIEKDHQLRYSVEEVQRAIMSNILDTDPKDHEGIVLRASDSSLTQLNLQGPDGVLDHRVTYLERPRVGMRISDYGLLSFGISQETGLPISTTEFAVIFGPRNEDPFILTDVSKDQWEQRLEYLAESLEMARIGI